MHKSSIGGSSSLPDMSEDWSNAINPNQCGSDGTVQVKCTKINGKSFKKIVAPDHILG